MSKPRIISPANIAELFKPWKLEPLLIQVGDEDLAVPAEESVRAFGTRILEFLDAYEVTYKTDTWDCDDFADLAFTLAKLDHARWYPKDSPPAGLAFGVVWFEMETGAHAINAAIHQKEDGTLCLKLYEPQIQPNDKYTLGVPRISLREFPLDLVRRFLFVRF